VQGIHANETDFPFLEVSRPAQLASYRKNVYRPACYIRNCLPMPTKGVGRGTYPYERGR